MRYRKELFVLAKNERCIFDPVCIENFMLSTLDRLKYSDLNFQLIDQIKIKVHFLKSTPAKYLLLDLFFQVTYLENAYRSFLKMHLKYLSGQKIFLP
jgi:hypothetical protein